MATAAAVLAQTRSRCVLRLTPNACQLPPLSLQTDDARGHSSQGGGIYIGGGDVDIVSTSISNCEANVSAPEPAVRQL